MEAAKEVTQDKPEMFTYVIYCTETGRYVGKHYRSPGAAKGQAQLYCQQSHQWIPYRDQSRYQVHKFKLELMEVIA